MKTFIVINGPNLNLLGKREPGIYGKQTLAQLEQELAGFAKKLDIRIDCKQTNHEATLIDWIHAADSAADGIVLNAAAFTHYSYAIRDAIESVSVPVIEVHISNVHARESFRHQSVISPVVQGQIVGMGFTGYKLALQGLADLTGTLHKGEEN